MKVVGSCGIEWKSLVYWSLSSEMTRREPDGGVKIG